jgi:hypothetical protein
MMEETESSCLNTRQLLSLLDLCFHVRLGTLRQRIVLPHWREEWSDTIP